jgi:hypothetical protein
MDMKRTILTIGAALAALTIAVLWLTREKTDSSAAVSAKAEQARNISATRTGSGRVGDSSLPATSGGAWRTSEGVAPISPQAPRATVAVGQKTVQLTPNQVGNFQRTYIQPKETLPVEVVFPQGEPGQTVVLEAKDGGTFDDKKLAQVAKLDAQRRLAFTFHADRQPGIYRVSMRRGSEEKVLNFWVGDPPPVQER